MSMSEIESRVRENGRIRLKAALDRAYEAYIAELEPLGIYGHQKLSTKTIREALSAIGEQVKKSCREGVELQAVDEFLERHLTNGDGE